MEHVYWRNPMFAGTSKDYYFHYSNLSCSEISILMRLAIQADVCRLAKIGANHVLFVFV